MILGKKQTIMSKKLLLILLCVPLIFSCSPMKVQTYNCGICKMKFKDQDWANQCQSWCEEYKSCNAEITKYAIE